MKPIRFNKERNKREAVIIDKLKNIRTAQVSFKAVYGEYAGSFDTLIDFLKNGKFPIVKKIGDIPDSLYEKGMTEEEAIKEGIIIRDSTFVDVSDSLFKDKGNFYIDSIAYIPFSGGVKFHLEAGEKKQGGVKVRVFYVFAANKYLLKGLDEKKFKPEEGLSVGSMEEPSIDGNWE